MELKKLFEFVDGLLGDMATFQGLQFNLPHGIMIIDFVKEIEYPLPDGSHDIVDGYVIDFAPYDGVATSYFALDEEGIKEIISENILE